MLEHNTAQATLDYIISEADLQAPPDLAKLHALFRQAPAAAQRYFFRDDQAEQIVLQFTPEAGPPEAALGRRFVLAEARDALVEVIVSADRMEARMRVSGPYGGQAVNLDLVRSALRQANVTAGLDSAAIGALLRDGAVLSAGNSRELLIARGRLPQRGDNARLERLTRTAAERMLQPQEREDGSVDMRDLGALVTIGKGELLMRKHEATPGIAGYDVSAAPIPAQAGEDIKLLAGVGAVFHPADGNLLIAMRDGTPVAIDNGMKVDDVVVLKKVDVSTGHVRFKGSVIIEGDVREGMEVESEGDVTILGVTRSNEEVRLGDRFFPTEERAVNSTFMPREPASQVDGLIIDVPRGVNQIGLMDVVTINKGQRDGLAEGSVLAIMKTGETVRDRVTGQQVKVPDERGGLLMVFRTFDKISYGLVLTASRDLALMDKVTNP